MMRGRLFLLGLPALVVALVATGSPARADVTVDRSGSILVFPKVISNSERDTIIQISNTGNTLVHAHCFYTNAAPTNPNLPPGPTNPPLWQETDFFIWLTRQQPTHWTASQGRPVNPFDSLGSEGAGLDPGLVPPVGSNFQGELMCVEVGADGNPVSGNHLKGEATLKTLATGDVSKYAGIAILGGAGAGATGRTLRLDNSQYNSCPNVLLLDHFSHGVENPVIGSPNNLGECPGGDCPIETELTIIPCGRDFENQVPGTVTISIETFDEFEQLRSTSTTVTCWSDLPLDQIGSGLPFVRDTLSVYARLRPVGGGGILGVAEEIHRDGAGREARAAFNLHMEGDLVGEQGVIDEIVLTGP
ncbi:MAG: hypothetical protein KatS3mg076_2244 [Candidatus Binatia bacterium]|nr:MAG: hypothetical protein KatS3mg076_2244 [Candidatus Binatia bacterium]